MTLFCFYHICSIRKIWVILEGNRRVSMVTNSCGLKKMWQHFLHILTFLFCDFFFPQSWVYNDKHVRAWFLIFNIKKILPECAKKLSSLMYTCKKLSACCYVVKTLQEGYVNTNCCRLTHTRATRAGECYFLSLPLWKINTEASLS